MAYGLDQRFEQATPDLQEWERLHRERHWSGLLVGNGASRAVWNEFAYASLYATARDLAEGGLSPADRELFTRLDTHNFESVLSALRTTGVVNEALNLPTEVIGERYLSIRRALANAVRTVHIPWPRVRDASLQVIRTTLLSYEWVFSTNYDLLLYWAIMSGLPNPPDIKDFFWHRCAGCEDGPWLCFVPSDVEVSSPATRVVYLHGALHLYELSPSQAAKRVSGARNLLDVFYELAEEDAAAIPLFVAEGRAIDKMQAIGESPYLSFAYDRLVAHREPLVIFGHSLGSNDQHIVDAVDGHHHLAISIQRTDDNHIRSEKARYMQMFPGANIGFFDAASHPLGSTAVNMSDTAA
jgi:sirohydrochlorin ferrochelatase